MGARKHGEDARRRAATGEPNRFVPRVRRALRTRHGTCHRAGPSGPFVREFACTEGTGVQVRRAARTGWTKVNTPEPSMAPCRDCRTEAARTRPSRPWCRIARNTRFHRERRVGRSRYRTSRSAWMSPSLLVRTPGASGGVRRGGIASGGMDTNWDDGVADRRQAALGPRSSSKHPSQCCGTCRGGDHAESQEGPAEDPRSGRLGLPGKVPGTSGSVHRGG